MTALNLSTQIPPAINTVEGAAAWALLTLQTMNPQMRVLETDLANERVVDSGIFKAADGTTRLWMRVSFEIDPAWASDNSKKFWLQVKEFSQTQIPSAFTSN
jgi:hypothetical protein